MPTKLNFARAFKNKKLKKMGCIDLVFVSCISFLIGLKNVLDEVEPIWLGIAMMGLGVYGIILTIYGLIDDKRRLSKEIEKETQQEVQEVQEV